MFVEGSYLHFPRLPFILSPQISLTIRIFTCILLTMPKLFVEKQSKLMLRLLQGDFWVTVEVEKYHRLSAEIWDRVLPK